jgi:hypothetical protein
VNAGKLLYVLDEGVTVFVATRETREYEDGDTGVSPETLY